MSATQVPWSASSATIALVNVIKSLVSVAPSTGAVSFANFSSLANVRCTAFPPLLRAIGVNLIVAEFRTGKWSVHRPYSSDGKIHRFNGRNRNCCVRS
jgi:hypothetical protein